MKPAAPLVMIIAIFIAGLGAILIKDRIEIFANSASHTATIVDCKWSVRQGISRSGGGTRTVYSYAPVAVSKQGYRATGNFKVTRKSLCAGMIGDEVTMLVNKDDPEQARINSFLQLWFFPFILFGFAATGLASLLNLEKPAFGFFCGFILFGFAAAAIEFGVFQTAPKRPILQPVDTEKALQACIDLAMRVENVQTPRAIKSLTCKGRSINDLANLRPLTSLEELDLSGNAITSLAPLGALTQLRVLTLDGNKPLNSLDGLQGLNQLEVLKVHCAELVQIDAAAELTSLRYLDVSCNKLSSLSAITNLDLLETLIIDDNRKLTNILAAANKPRLEVITMYHTPISDISPLLGNDKLRRVNIGSAANVSCRQIEELRSRLPSSAKINGPKACKQR